MYVCKSSCVAIFVVPLALIGSVGVAQTVPTEQPSPEAVAKLIAQLNAPRFRARQQASEELEKLGHSVLPALRKAAAANAELELRRRIELVASRIENAALKAEEDRWQDLEAPRRAIKDRLVTILGKKPALSDQQVAMVVYLLAVVRPPTDEEVKQAQKQLAATNSRTLSVLQLTRSLVV